MWWRYIVHHFLNNIMTIPEIRSLFPYLETGAIYFNHAAVSPLSTHVVAAMQEHIAMRSTGAIDDYNKILKTFATARARTAELINAESDRIAFAENTSTGLNILAQGLQWKQGDEIILNSIEFPSNVYPFLNLKSQGVNIEFVKAHDGIVSAEDIIAAVTQKTKLISISFVQFLTGYRADMQMLGEYCRAHNIIFCVDAIQGLGALQLDVKKCCVDYVSCGTQKWLMSEPGLAFIYLTPELQERLKPAFVGWLSVNNAWDLLNFDLSLKKDATALQTGTTNNIAIAAFAAALGVMGQIPAAEREKIVLDNSEYFIGRLLEAGYKPILTGVDRKYVSGIVSFPHENAQQIFEKLTKANITGSLREGIIRFSPHFYNTKEEIDKVLIEL
jgi:selenocysteine lyase/cysteine desulfurase